MITLRRKVLLYVLLFMITAISFIGFEGQAEADAGFIQDAAMEYMNGQNGEIYFFGIKDVLQFVIRIIFYFMMLGLTGWVLWIRWFGAGYSGSLRVLLHKAAAGLQQSYTVIYILFMGVHLGSLIASGGKQALISLFTETTVGYAWVGGFMLALLSFVWLYRSAWMDYVWVAAVWFGTSMLGHAPAFEPKGGTLVLDLLHLGAASVWTGGLLLLLVLWRKRHEETQRFLSQFSNVALFCMVLLIGSGTGSAFLFLPDIEYVLETVWGRWLLVKCALVLLIAIIAIWMRLAYRRKSGERSIGRLLVIDAALMGCVVVIVGIFTYLSPLPPNKPLYYHVMGEKIHMTAQIGPKAPGVNDFTVKVWLPEPLGAPKRVVMKLQEKNSADMAPLEVPLSLVEDHSTDENFGMPRYTYKANGAYLPYRGDWKLEVRVINRNDEETVYHHEFKVY